MCFQISTNVNKLVYSNIDLVQQLRFFVFNILNSISHNQQEISKNLIFYSKLFVNHYFQGMSFLKKQSF
jgi:hypothetical protein